MNFGGKDAIINSYLVTALSAMADLATFLGGAHAAEAPRWRALHGRAVRSMNEQMWNESAGLYSDWIDIRGGRRNYFYVWQQFNAIDPTSGLTNQSRAKRMLSVIDRYYSEMRARYNKTVDELWCTPTNLDAARGPNWSGLAPYDGYQQGKLQDQQWFGHYENGCCFMSMLGMELAARGQAGDPDGALALAQRAMKHFNTSRFWGQHYDWCTGDHCDGPANGFSGADVLANSALILHGSVRAMFGFHCDLSGVHVVGSPAKILKEGATHRFVHLGKRVTLTVHNGATVVAYPLDAPSGSEQTSEPEATQAESEPGPPSKVAPLAPAAVSAVRPRGAATDITPVHDPSGIVIDGGFGFIFSTSYGDEGGVQMRRTATPVSAANVSDADWLPHSVVFAPSVMPKWLDEQVPLPPAPPGHPPPARTLWAPDVSYHEASREWRLYYAASSFGSQRSCIGLAVTASLLHAPSNWIDRGPALCSSVCAPINTPSPHACNAIDPHVVSVKETATASSGGGHLEVEEAETEELYMVFGSFWTGIKLLMLNASTGLQLLPEQAASEASAARLWDVAENYDPDPPRPIEASWLEYDPVSKFYWLFVNWGMCCRGIDSTYNIRVGRARSVTGPFVDANGTRLEAGGGTLLLGTEGQFIGPGQLGLLRVDDDELGGWIASMHYYNGKDGGKPYLRLMRMVSQDGWPVLSEFEEEEEEEEEKEEKGERLPK